MRIKSLRIKNFRGYYNETLISFEDLTVLVGKNDIGKSTILEALDIFFNDGKGAIKLDKDDVNKQALVEGNNTIYISLIFEELPEKVIIDASYETTLSQEFLLNRNCNLEIVKKYTNGGNGKVFINAYHPNNSSCSELLLKKNSDLKKMIQSNDIECANQSINSIMRRSIWNHYSDDLQLEDVELDVTKGDTKDIWERLQTYLPVYSLFQSDRKNSDSDSEVQDPLKEAVRQILSDVEISKILNSVAERVSKRLKEVSASTLKKIKEMNPEVASSLNPIIPPSASLKWSDVFKSVSISGDGDIPINKRGSGIKRLILMNFFRAEAERRLKSGNTKSIIFAIEEPETSQHTEHQKILIKAFIDLSGAKNTQVLLTTHSSTIVKALKFENLRLVSVNSLGNKSIEAIVPSQLPYPSLNEVNYIAFRDLTEEYHNELYAYIEAEELLKDYKVGKSLMLYNKILKNGSTRAESITLTEYIRHQIHHPENLSNQRYTFSQLTDSVDLMQDFLAQQK